MSSGTESRLPWRDYLFIFSSVLTFGSFGVMDFIEYDALMDVDSNYNAAAREFKYTSFY